MGKPALMAIARLRSTAMAQLEDHFDLRRCWEADDAARFVAEHGADCRAVLATGHSHFTAGMLADMPKLELVSLPTAGFDGLPVAEMAARGIRLTNASPALRDDVADTAIMLILAAQRSLVAADGYVRSGAWARDGMYPLQKTVSGRRLGIVGMGSLGSAVAERASALRMEVSYWNRAAKDVPWRYEPELATLAAKSDVLVATVAGGPDTAGLISRQVIEALGPDGLFINIARGSVVDEEALIEALQSGTLGRAGLDVYENEPEIDARLTALENVTLFPHHASGTEEARAAMSQMAVDNLLAFAQGRALLSEVAI
ncbi:Lactate dehydrogenase [Paracoccus isoporae]|uniref:Lactate dehydrogenase n=1 Tax=Paracoccus isoporae TaxID=591205 RepID=A0A1G7DF76_9RHOB|nr:2-hydroxyacid dehydrogenase [Paracoccus isoporae]SDE49680.1 Lactate dehydrogenase [Paracoccus isoporae]